MVQGEDRALWQARWQSGQTRWDQGQEHPELPRLLRHARLEGQLQSGAAIYSGGCGRAHSEAYLARQGYRVTASDLVPEAIEGARQLYGQQERLVLRCEDAFQVRDEDLGSFDAAFDRAMLCALQPSHRDIYVTALAKRLKPGAIFMAILFLRVEGAGGPPFAVDEATALALFARDFDLAWAAAAPPPIGGLSVREEWLCIWRRK